MTWRQRPVFISSTFSDMQAERDHLRDFVLPALEERLAERQRHLEWVDLRLGVAAGDLRGAEAREAHVLEVCLSTVRRCHPFMIVLLGDRYGWTPESERIEAAAREAGYAAPVDGLSVTELEIRVGALDATDGPTRVWCYLREPLPYDRMTPAVARQYSDAYDDSPGAYERRQRLSALKRRIEAEAGARARRYEAGWDARRRRVVDLEAWGDQVLEDLWSDMARVIAGEDAEASLATAAAEDWRARERRALDVYAEERARDFVGRAELLDRLSAVARGADGGPELICLTGDAGAGKSAVFGALKRRLEAEDGLLLSHAAGAGPAAPRVDAMLLRWIGELEQALGADSNVDEGADAELIRAAFHGLLARAAADRGVTLLIDALDQFEASEDARRLSWLPESWPAGARLVATAIPGAESAALAVRENAELLALPPLAQSEAREIIAAVCRRYHRALEPEIVDALLAKRRDDAPAWANTLWLTLAVETVNLVGADDFDRAMEGDDGDPAERLKALMLARVDDMPADAPGLYRHAFRRAESLYGATHTLCFLGAVAVSRGGWRESDFQQLLPALSHQRWEPLRFAGLRRLFRGQIRRRGEHEQWTFAHDQMRRAARAWLAERGASEPMIHAQVAEHLLGLDRSDPLRESETMAHLIGAENWSLAGRYYSDGALTDNELASIERTLADAMSAPERDGVSGIRRMLDALPEDDSRSARLHNLTLRLLYTLRARLNDRVSVQPQIDLVSHIMESVDELRRGQPDDADIASFEFEAAHWRGNLRFQIGDLAAALTDFEQARRSAEWMCERDPQNLAFQDYLSRAHDRLANTKMFQGDTLGGLESFEAARAISARLLADNPDNEDLAIAVAAHDYGIANILRAQGDTDDAMRRFESAADLTRRLIEKDPGNDFLQMNLSAALSRIGDVHVQRNAFTEALDAFRETQAVLERQVIRQPDDIERRVALATCSMKMGEALNGLGEHREARRLLESALAAARDAGAEDADNQVWRRKVNHMREFLGDALLGLKQIDAAIDQYGRTIELREALCAADPSNAEWRIDLSQALEKFGAAKLQARDQKGALAAWERCETIRAALAAEDPETLIWRQELERIRGRLEELRKPVRTPLSGAAAAAKSEAAGRALHARATEAHQRGMMAEAVAQMRAALVHFRRARDEQGAKATDDSRLQFEMNVGAVLADLGGWTKDVPLLREAEQSLKRCLAIAERASPGNHAICLLNLGEVYRGLGSLGEDQDLLRQALAHHEHALAAFEEIGAEELASAARSELNKTRDAIGDMQQGGDGSDAGPENGRTGGRPGIGTVN